MSYPTKRDVEVARAIIESHSSGFQSDTHDMEAIAEDFTSAIAAAREGGAVTERQRVRDRIESLMLHNDSRADVQWLALMQCANPPEWPDATPAWNTKGRIQSEAREEGHRAGMEEAAAVALAEGERHRRHDSPERHDAARWVYVAIRARLASREKGGA